MLNRCLDKWLYGKRAEEEMCILADHCDGGANRVHYKAAGREETLKWVDFQSSFVQKCTACVCLIVILSFGTHQWRYPHLPVPCGEYFYPQCERAIIHYLEHGASHRCEAFERVKAEGDFLRFPNLPHREDLCNKAGCCPCPGQCSKCPPVMPECMTWKLDGVWKVAFTNGALATYRFDGNGSVEEEMPEILVPKYQSLVRRSGKGRGRVFAVAGSVVPDATGDTFILNLGNVAPDMFPHGAVEVFRLTNGELQVQREVKQLSKELAVGSRVQAEYQGDWYPGTVVGVPADDVQKLGRWAVRADYDYAGSFTYATRVREHRLMVAVNGTGVRVMQPQLFESPRHVRLSDGAPTREH